MVRSIEKVSMEMVVVEASANDESVSDKCTSVVLVGWLGVGNPNGRQAVPRYLECTAAPEIGFLSPAKSPRLMLTTKCFAQ